VEAFHECKIMGCFIIVFDISQKENLRILKREIIIPIKVILFS